MGEDTFNPSRRRMLAAPSTTGVAPAGAGLGTSAYLSDREPFENNVSWNYQNERPSARSGVSGGWRSLPVSISSVVRPIRLGTAYV